MPGRTRRIIAGILRVIAGLGAWGVVCNAFSSVVFVYLQGERQVRLPAGTAEAYNGTTVAGAVLIPPVVAVLAIRAYLPGTCTRPSKLRGFAVESPRAGGDMRVQGAAAPAVADGG
jgi:hypothetical protein